MYSSLHTTGAMSSVQLETTGKGSDEVLPNGDASRSCTVRPLHYTVPRSLNRSKGEVKFILSSSCDKHLRKYKMQYMYVKTHMHVKSVYMKLVTQTSYAQNIDAKNL